MFCTGPRDIRFEDRPEPKIAKPTDAVIRLSAQAFTTTGKHGLDHENALLYVGVHNILKAG